MLQAYVRGTGRVAYESTKLSFSDETKLTNADGWKLNLCYDNNKSWSLSLPKFDTARVSVKDKRYFLRTKYSRVLDSINELAGPVAQYIYANRERLGVTKSEDDIKKMLIKDLFVARTLHSNVFVDINTNKPMDLNTLKSRFRVKVYVKPVVYIRGEEIYIDLEIARATISTDLTKKSKNNESEEVVASTSEKKSTKKPSEKPALAASNA